eukprot:jgi/Ulvmu1/908/UM101_0017.1
MATAMATLFLVRRGIMRCRATRWQSVTPRTAHQLLFVPSRGLSPPAAAGPQHAARVCSALREVSLDAIAGGPGEAGWLEEAYAQPGACCFCRASTCWTLQRGRHGAAAGGGGAACMHGRQHHAYC